MCFGIALVAFARLFVRSLVLAENRNEMSINMSHTKAQTAPSSASFCTPTAHLLHGRIEMEEKEEEELDLVQPARAHKYHNQPFKCLRATLCQAFFQIAIALYATSLSRSLSAAGTSMAKYYLCAISKSAEAELKSDSKSNAL